VIGTPARRRGAISLPFVDGRRAGGVVVGVAAAVEETVGALA
jgi:hypothetical protein